MLVIFVRDVLYDLVHECSAQSVGTGLLGMMVCMNVYTLLCSYEGNSNLFPLRKAVLAPCVVETRYFVCVQYAMSDTVSSIFKYFCGCTS